MINSRHPHIELVVLLPVPVKVTFSSSVFFDVDKPDLEVVGIAMLAILAQRVSGMNIDVVVAIGHTDSTETPDLSIARADFVKGILGGIGLEKNRIYTEGKGSKQPIANNTSELGQAKNRRVEIVILPPVNKKTAE